MPYCETFDPQERSGVPQERSGAAEAALTSCSESLRSCSELLKSAERHDFPACSACSAGVSPNVGRMKPHAPSAQMLLTSFGKRTTSALDFRKLQSSFRNKSC